jgi:hypothetical protein
VNVAGKEKGITTYLISYAIMKWLRFVRLAI